jgi:hypothetical protein
MKMYHSLNRARDNRRIKERRKRIAEDIKKYIKFVKGSTPCDRCGNYFPYYVMNFHHIKGSKRGDVSRMSDARGWRVILEEIEKCEILCGNCHAIREHEAMVSTGADK